MKRNEMHSLIRVYIDSLDRVIGGLADLRNVYVYVGPCIHNLIIAYKSL